MTLSPDSFAACEDLSSIANLLASIPADADFGNAAAFVYNPLDYAREPHLAYLQRYGAAPKRVLFLGMNPGPFGMVQTGVPFGEIAAVRDWLGISGRVGTPARMHPKRPVQGFACKRSEESGKRLWALFAERFGTADAFFREHFVVNYCPLAFVTETSGNLTPDKLPAAIRRELLAICDAALVRTVAILRPKFVVGIGVWARKRAEEALSAAGLSTVVASMLHPSPASPIANRGFPEKAKADLLAHGIWQD